MVLGICQEEKNVYLYMGLKCPCCSEKGDSEKKTKLVAFSAANFYLFAVWEQQDAQRQTTQAGVILHQCQNKWF